MLTLGRDWYLLNTRNNIDIGKFYLHKTYRVPGLSLGIFKGDSRTHCLWAAWVSWKFHESSRKVNWSNVSALSAPLFGTTRNTSSSLPDLSELSSEYISNKMNNVSETACSGFVTPWCGTHGLPPYVQSKYQTFSLPELITKSRNSENTMAILVAMLV